MPGYNQHVRLLSSEPFGWFAPPKSTRAWEPTLFMESLNWLTARTAPLPSPDANRHDPGIASVASVI